MCLIYFEIISLCSIEVGKEKVCTNILHEWIQESGPVGNMGICFEVLHLLNILCMSRGTYREIVVSDYYI